MFTHTVDEAAVLAVLDVDAGLMAVVLVRGCWEMRVYW